MSKLFDGYNSFNNIEKSQDHIITINKNSGIGICDLNENCSSLELQISNLEKEEKKKEGDLTINTVQSNKINIDMGTNIKSIEYFYTSDINYELFFIFFIIIMLIYF